MGYDLELEGIVSEGLGTGLVTAGRTSSLKLERRCIMSASV